MRVLTVSRIVAILAGIAVVGACSDGFDPSPPDTPSPDLQIMLAPTAVRMSPGEKATFRAHVIDRQGNLYPQVTIRWTSSNSAVASVSAAGEVFARREGSTVIIAAAGLRTQTARVQVLGPGPKQELPNMDPVRKTR